MTDAYFYKSIFTRRLGSVLAEVKRTSGSLETKPILKEALIYRSQFPNTIHKKFQKLPRYHLISRQGKNKFQVL
jgi:hypothetical protein